MTYNIVDSDLVADTRILIIDDICSRGGTFYHAAQALRAAGATEISLYVTHCENTILEGELFTTRSLKNIYTTSSLVHTEELAKKVIYV